MAARFPFKLDPQPGVACGDFRRRSTATANDERLQRALNRRKHDGVSGQVKTGHFVDGQNRPFSGGDRDE